MCSSLLSLLSRHSILEQAKNSEKVNNTANTFKNTFKTLVSDYHPVRSAEASHLGVLGYVVIDHLQLINHQKVWDRLLATDLVLPLISSRMHGNPGVQHVSLLYLQIYINKICMSWVHIFHSNMCTWPPLKQSKLHITECTTS